MTPALHSALDLERIRGDFPALRQRVHNHPLAYLDNAATTQKPQEVIDALCRFYSEDCANVHRGVHSLSERATLAYEGARETVREFLNAGTTAEIVFTRGATESINLVARTYGRNHVQRGDEILITGMEHHSNIVPWQMACEEKGARLRVAPVDERGEIVLEEMERLIRPRTKLVAVAQVSNALGTVNPASEIVRMAHNAGVPVLIDGAQGAPHLTTDVQALDCDFYVFSGHKTYGPTGIGVLYGKRELLESMPPYQGGGDMIRTVTFERTTYNDLPYKFEAGTPHIAGAIGLGAAIGYLNRIGLETLARHEEELLAYATDAVGGLAGVRLIGTARHKVGVLSFVLDGVHPHDIATVLDGEGIAIRAGHHCAQPLMERFGIPATSRASFAFYNTFQEIDRLVAAIGKVKEMFG